MGCIIGSWQPSWVGIDSQSTLCAQMCSHLPQHRTKILRAVPLVLLKLPLSRKLFNEWEMKSDANHSFPPHSQRQSLYTSGVPGPCLPGLPSMTSPSQECKRIWDDNGKTWPYQNPMCTGKADPERPMIILHPPAIAIGLETCDLIRTTHSLP